MALPAEVAASPEGLHAALRPLIKHRVVRKRTKKFIWPWPLRPGWSGVL